MRVEISKLDLKGAGRKVLEEVDELLEYAPWLARGATETEPATMTLHKVQCARVEVAVNAAIKRKRGAGSTAYEDRIRVAGKSSSTLTIGDMRYKGIELTSK